MKNSFSLVALLLILSATPGCIVNKQPEWKPEAFRLKCVNGQLVAFNGLGEEIELYDVDRECERVEKLKLQNANGAAK